MKRLTLIIVVVLFMSAVALAGNSHNGYGGYNYSSPTVTPTTVAPGDTITVDFSYTVTIDSTSYNSTGPGNTFSLWEVRLDANNKRADDQGNFISPLTSGEPAWDAPGTKTFYVNVDVDIPMGIGDGLHTIEIYSAAWKYQSAWYSAWYVITINVVSAPPEVLVQNLIDTVEGMNLQQGIDNSLDTKLDAARKAINDLRDNNDGAAINSLESFINEVEAQRDKKLTDEQTDILVAQAQAIIDLLS